MNKLQNNFKNLDNHDKKILIALCTEPKNEYVSPQLKSFIEKNRERTKELLWYIKDDNDKYALTTIDTPNYYFYVELSCNYELVKRFTFYYPFETGYKGSERGARDCNII